MTAPLHDPLRLLESLNVSHANNFAFPSYWNGHLGLSVFIVYTQRRKKETSCGLKNRYQQSRCEQLRIAVNISFTSLIKTINSAHSSQYVASCTFINFFYTEIREVEIVFLLQIAREKLSVWLRLYIYIYIYLLHNYIYVLYGLYGPWWKKEENNTRQLCSRYGNYITPRYDSWKSICPKSYWQRWHQMAEMIWPSCLATLLYFFFTSLTNYVKSAPKRTNNSCMGLNTTDIPSGHAHTQTMHTPHKHGCIWMHSSHTHTHMHTEQTQTHIAVVMTTGSSYYIAQETVHLPSTLWHSGAAPGPRWTIFGRLDGS